MKRLLSVFLATIIAVSCISFVSAEEFDFDIIKQPTVADPTFEVTPENEFTFQWYEVQEVTHIIEDTMTDYYYGTYDRPTQRWTADTYGGDNYGDYIEYGADWFDFYLNEGDTVIITFDDPSIISPDNEFRFYGVNNSNNRVKPVSDGVYIFTAPYGDVFSIYSYTVTKENVKAKFEVVQKDHVKIEDETEKTLSKLEFGKSYICYLFRNSELYCNSDVLTVKSEVVSQPTAKNPTFDITFEDKAKFQWYEASPTFVIFDDSMLDSDYFGEGYNKTNGTWQGNHWEDGTHAAYAIEYLVSSFKKGDVIKITISDPSVMPENNWIGFVGEKTAINQVRPDENGVYLFTVPDDDDYYIFHYAYDYDITAKIEISDYEYLAIEGETAKTLSEMENQKLYMASASFENGTKLDSDIFKATPIITKQPAADDPTVELNISNGIDNYQWYTMAIGAMEITEEYAKPMHFETSIGGPSYYDNKNKFWIGSLYDINYDSEGREIYQYHLFWIDLKEGEEFVLAPSAEIIDDLIYIDSAAPDDYLEDYDSCWTIENGVYTFKAPRTDNYNMYVLTYVENITFRAHLNDKQIIGDAVENETSNKLSAKEAGDYVCIITYKDGTQLISDVVTLAESGNSTLGDVNSDGAINQYDYILVKRHYFGTRYLTDDELARADANKDGAVNQYDYILIKRHYFGTYVIG